MVWFDTASMIKRTLINYLLNKFTDIFVVRTPFDAITFLRMFWSDERIALRKKATIPFNSWNALLREWRTTKLHPHDTKMNIIYLSKALLKCFLNVKKRKKIILKVFCKRTALGVKWWKCWWVRCSPLTLFGFGAKENMTAKKLFYK